MKLNKCFFGLGLFFLVIIHVHAQNGGHRRGFFFPVRPGEINYLSGSMGEIRSTHFHAGIDIKTSGTSGLPVYAIEDGYVSRIRVAGGGYGHALYLQHPGGETSVYGHLLRFREDIADYVRKKQYELESFEVNLFPDKDLFEINRGDLIALSGNTGSSLGPHLHFEIRDPHQRPVNPLKKGFGEIRDEIPPTISSFALKTMDINSRVENQFGRFNYPVRRRGTEFYVDTAIPVHGTIGVQIDAHDKFNGAANRNGIPYISAYLDGEELINIRIDTFSFGDSRHVINFYDYEERSLSRRTFQKLYIADGNNLPFYKYHKNRGVITITDDELHELEIELMDAMGNLSSLVIPLQGVSPSSRVDKIESSFKEPLETRLIDNQLVITSGFENDTPNHALVYSQRMQYDILPSYYSDQKAVYLWDMRVGLPDSLRICSNSKVFNYKVMIPSGTDFNFYNRLFDIRTFRSTLYDTLYLETDHKVLPDNMIEIFTIGNSSVPLANSMQITFKPELDYQNSGKYAMYSTTDMKNFSFESNDWDQGTIRIRTRNLGLFTILEDTIPPQITPLQVNRKRASFRIRDDLSGIKEYEARLNGEWLLMHYDPKQDYIRSEMLEPNNPVKGELSLYVEDNAGNINHFKTTIK